LFVLFGQQPLTNFEKPHAGSRQNRLRAMVRRLMIIVALVLAAPAATPAERTVRITVLGDSLVAGFRISQEDAFPAKLERMLRAKGLSVEVINAGVSGDTTSAGLARLDGAIPEGTDAVIIELGTNDVLRAIPPSGTRAALQEIVQRLRRRDIDILLCGAWPTRQADALYEGEVSAMFAELAGKNGLIFYPYFLEGVEEDPKLTLDGLHPNPAGVDEIVARILPSVEELVARVRARLNAAPPE
jgi:acyl-CoA thioesterase-1